MPAPEPTVAGYAPRPAPQQEQQSIAVLPLVNLSGNPENEYFSDGLAETLLDMLARVPDLKVIARTSSFAFKGKSEDVRKIGKALDATHLLEGSVQQSGQRLRITVQLIRTRDGAHLWSQRYDRQLADVFDVQDEVATEIVKAMQLALPATATARPMRAGGTENVAAYQEYLRGIALLPMRRVQDMQAAVGHFERAIELDPRYAMAYAMCSQHPDHAEWPLSACRPPSRAPRAVHPPGAAVGPRSGRGVYRSRRACCARAIPLLRSATSSVALSWRRATRPAIYGIPTGSEPMSAGRPMQCP